MLVFIYAVAEKWSRIYLDFILFKENNPIAFLHIIICTATLVQKAALLYSDIFKCQTKAKQPFWRKNWFVILILFLVLYFWNNFLKFFFAPGAGHLPTTIWTEVRVISL